MCAREWKYSDFAKTVPKLREMTKMKGLSGSYAMVYLMSSPRMKWNDDMAWNRAASNFALLGRIAREGGLKGFFVDHEDYTGSPLFMWREGDPDYAETRRLARRRGKQMFEALAKTFPDAVIINDRILEQYLDTLWSQTPCESTRALRELWYPFVNGAVDALAPGMRFMDGCERTYYFKTNDDYRKSGYMSRVTGLALIDPRLRAKYIEQSGLCYANFLDLYVLESGPDMVSATSSLFGSAALSEGTIWVYGERHPVIDWGRKMKKDVSETPWMFVMPDLPTVLRTAVGDYSLVRARADRGELANLVRNSSCDGGDGNVPAPFDVYTKIKDPPAGLFARDAEIGCKAPGSLRLSGCGNFTFSEGKLSAGDRVYVRFSARGSAPSANVVWRKNGAWSWHTEYQSLAKPSRVESDGWKTFEVCMIAPEGVDGIGMIFNACDCTPQSPCWFDDISIYRW